MTLVSLDAIPQADATMIVGVVFIMTLKEALKHKVTGGDLVMVTVAICFYVFSATGSRITFFVATASLKK